MHRNTPNGIAFGSVQGPELGLADAYRVCQHGLEHRLELAGRTADNLQHLRCRGFSCKCLVAFAGEPRDVCYLIGSDGVWTIAALQRLGALRF